jgi:hypothetical protein
MSARLRLCLVGLALVLLASACTMTIRIGASPTPPVSITRSMASPSPTGAGSAAAALAKLCEHPASQPPSAVPHEGPTPPAIEDVEKAVEQLRGLEFTEPVAADPVTHDELVRGLEESFDASFPSHLYERRSLAWQTLGVIPPGTSIRQAIEEFGTSQVIGYYDTQTGELVFIGTEDPSPLERVTLAHELTHAIDDQHFNLSRIDALGSTCQDDAYDAAVAVVEGNATYLMTQYALKDLSLEEQLQLALEAGSAPSTAGVPEFILQTEEWPYTAGLSFITALQTSGGMDAVNGALDDLPVTTEQIIHPEKYPSDVPQSVDVSDLGPELGAGWTDLDVQYVGEEFLALMLDLRLDGTSADASAAGWDGGLYRAWRSGDHVALVLSTVWDTPQDASEFASAMQRWIDAGEGSAAVLPAEGSGVRVLFASDPETLSALTSAAE